MNRSIFRPRMAALVTASALTMLALPAAVGAAAAYASCAGTPEPSPYAFTGTVLSVEDGGTVATVETDDGSTVTVIGGPGGGGNGMSSVDRTYKVGVRYEFHPLNDQSPYEDNICTATHTLADQTPPTPPGTTGAGGSGQQGASGTGSAQQQDWSGLSVGLAALAVLGVLGLGLVMVSRRSAAARPGH